jgi:STE24 endopeptidase
MTQTIDQQRQTDAREYARVRRRLMLVDLAIGVVYLLLWLLTGLSFALRAAIAGITDTPWVVLTLFIAVFGGIYYLITLPLGYYSGFVLPHRYDMSNQSLKSWGMDQLKGLLISVPLGLILIQIVYSVIAAAPGTWWLWTALILLFFNVILANLAPIIIAPLFYKFQPLQESHAELVERLRHLAAKANVQVRGVYKFDMSRRTKAANAALFGLGNTRRIILGDTLLNEFTDDEIETILAHELGHHVHQDIPLGILIGSLTTLLGLYLASLALTWGVGYFGFSGLSDPASLPLLALVLGAFGAISMPVDNAFSRWRERRADIYALDMTNKAEAYASAMARLANQNLAEADPEPWVEWLLYSHPALNKRISMARAYPTKKSADPS